MNDRSVTDISKKLNCSSNRACMKELQPEQTRVKFDTKFLLEGITPSSGVSLGP
jgi:hypothetical protein